MTETSCNLCGECCDPVVANYTVEGLADHVEDLRAAGADVSEAEANLAFARDHWTEVGSEGLEVFFACDAFDRSSGLCTAHDSRPPACRNYPWGGKTREMLTALDAVKLRRYPKCEFFADLPPEVRPEGWEPVLLTTRPRET